MIAQTGNFSVQIEADYLLRRSRCAKTGLHLLMAAMSSMFFLFLISYILRSQVSDWEALSEPWQPLASTWQLWINTAFLVLASVALELAKRSLRRSDKALTRDLMLVAGAASVAFLVGQLVFWNALGNMGYFASSNAANAFFYLLTGLHGVHLLGGLVAWVRAIYRLNHDNSEQASAKAGLGVELCATYWHFLLFVWLGLFALLSSSPATYAAIAKLCGF
jgi:cytochrome c oxidase subunit 3